MTRSTTLGVAALCAAGAFLLSGCGGGGGANDGAHPSGSGSASSSATNPTPSATASATAPALSGAPKFDLPPDVTVKFDGFDGGSATHAALLRDTSYAATAVLEFEAHGYPTEPSNFARYWAGGTGAEFADSIISQEKDGTVITGAYHYYRPVVKSLPDSGGNMSVTYCEDQRKAYSKVAKTGKVLTTQPSLSDFRQWTLLMTKGPHGDWQAFNHTWTKGAKQCEIS